MSRRYIPSKVCPHRACRYLHETVSWAAVAVGLTGFQLWLQIALGVMLLLRISTVYMRRKYKLPSHPLPGERPNEYLIVRRWWVRAAVAGDIVLAVFVLAVLASNIAARAYGITPTGGGVLAALIGSLLMFTGLAVVVFCHWMSTRPGKPKRVKMPRGAAFQGAV